MSDLVQRCQWQYGKWMDKLGIKHGLAGCEGKTIDRVVEVDLYSDKKLEDDFAYSEHLIIFTDGERRLSETQAHRRLVSDYERLVAGGVITAVEREQIEAGEAADQRMMDEENDRRRRAQMAAKRAYDEAYKA